MIFNILIRGDIKMTKIKKAWESYLQLGTNTRLVIRITLVMFFSIWLTAIYALTASYADNYYELLLLADDLIECAKSISGTGFLCVIITGIAEGKIKHQT